MKQWIIRYRYHIIFWVGAHLLSLAILFTQVGWLDAFIQTSISGLFVLGVFYGNLLFLIPRFLSKGKYVQYIVISIVLIFLVTLLRYYIDLLWFQQATFLKHWFQASTEYRKIVRYYFATNFQYFAALVYSLHIDLVREKATKAELERQRLDAELKFLKSQLRPHFLLNTLNNIYTLSYLKDPLATPMLMKLSDSLKYLLYDGDAESVYLQDEVHFIENYIELNKLRLDTPQRIEFCYTGVTPHQQVPPLLFLVFIENAFKHSDVDENEQGFIHIKLDVMPPVQLVFICTNTIRLTRSNLNEKSGIGLHNIRQRLDILFGENYILDIQQRDQIHEVTLRIMTQL